MSYWMSYEGCRDGAVVRAITSHQCGPGSIPRSGVKCGLSLSVLFSAPRGFLRVLQFPLSSKNQCTTWFVLVVSLISKHISTYLQGASSTRIEIKYVILRPNESRKVITYNVTSTQPPLALFPSQQRNGDLIWSAWVQFPACSVFSLLPCVGSFPQLETTLRWTFANVTLSLAFSLVISKDLPPWVLKDLRLFCNGRIRIRFLLSISLLCKAMLWQEHFIWCGLNFDKCHLG